jgi:hypothetical protein
VNRLPAAQLTSQPSPRPAMAWQVRALRSGLRPSLRHTTRTVSQFSHEHRHRNWEGVTSPQLNCEGRSRRTKIKSLQTINRR